MTSYLAKYSHDILEQHMVGRDPMAIATWLFDNPMRGQWPDDYRDIAIRAMSHAIRSYVAHKAAAIQECRRLQAEELRQRSLYRQRQEAGFAATPAWRDRDWEDVLPPDIAARQASWCRHMAALRMRQADFTYTEIGWRLRVTAGRAKQIVEKAQRYENSPRGNRSPLDNYLGQLVVIDGYTPLVDIKEARQMLKHVEAWTGRPTVVPCSAWERYIWELYYSMRGAA
jgi:hypothetical protein